MFVALFLCERTNESSSVWSVSLSTGLDAMWRRSKQGELLADLMEVERTKQAPGSPVVFGRAFRRLLALERALKFIGCLSVCLFVDNRVSCSSRSVEGNKLLLFDSNKQTLNATKASERAKKTNNANCQLERTATWRRYSPTARDKMIIFLYLR